MRQTLEFFASDALEGRYASSTGNAQAGDRIADDFAKLGLTACPRAYGILSAF